MQSPLQITQHNLSLSDVAEQRIRSQVAKLEQFCGRIISCHVTVDAPHHHKHKGECYDVKITIAVPGEELVIRHEPDEDLYVAIRDAFDAARRKLQEHVERRSGEARLHAGKG
jgi:ribosomal subunit interface protein